MQIITLGNVFIVVEMDRTSKSKYIHDDNSIVDSADHVVCLESTCEPEIHKQQQQQQQI